MTEFGMALSNALEVDARKPGCVGLPLRSVEVRIVADDGHVVEPPEETAGELRVRGANVFQGYWRKPEATEEAFDEEVCGGGCCCGRGDMLTLPRWVCRDTFALAMWQHGV